MCLCVCTSDFKWNVLVINVERNDRKYHDYSSDRLEEIE